MRTHASTAKTSAYPATASSLSTTAEAARAAHVDTFIARLPPVFAPGAREQRWAHLLCGPVDLASPATGQQAAAHGTTADRLERLEAEVAELRAILERLHQELGLSPFGQK